MVSASALLSTLAIASGMVAAMPNLPAAYGAPETICKTSLSTSVWTKEYPRYSTSYSTCYSTSTSLCPWSSVSQSCATRTSKKTWTSTSCKVESYPVTSISWVTKSTNIEIPHSSYDTYTDTYTTTLRGVSTRYTTIPSVVTRVATSTDCSTSSTVISSTSCRVTTPAPAIPTGYGY